MSDIDVCRNCHLPIDCSSRSPVHIVSGLFSCVLPHDGLPMQLDDYRRAFAQSLVAPDELFTNDDLDDAASDARAEGFDDGRIEGMRDGWNDALRAARERLDELSRA